MVFAAHLLLTLILVVVCAGLLFLILIQRSKNEGLGGAFGMGGGSETVLGSRVSILQKWTAWLVGIFMVLCLVISLLPPVTKQQSVPFSAGNIPSPGAAAVPGAALPDAESPDAAAPDAAAPAENPAGGEGVAE